MSSSSIGPDHRELVADAPADVEVEPLGVDDAAVDEVEALAEDRVEDAVLDEARHLLLDHRRGSRSVERGRRSRRRRPASVCSPGMTSIIGIRCGGFDQCMPTTRSGWAQAVAIFVIGMPEVFDARIGVVGDVLLELAGRPRA